MTIGLTLDDLLGQVDEQPLGAMIAQLSEGAQQAQLQQ